LIRKLDELGRVVIPIEFRKANGWKDKDEIEMFENENEITLVKATGEHCKECGQIIHRKDRYCCNCGIMLKK